MPDGKTTERPETLSFVIRHLSSVICQSSSVICHLSFVICHLSVVICHPGLHRLEGGEAPGGGSWWRGREAQPLAARASPAAAAAGPPTKPSIPRKPIRIRKLDVAGRRRATAVRPNAINRPSMSVERARSGDSFSVELAFSNEPLIFVGCSFKPEDSPIKNEGRPRLRRRSGPAGSGTATRVPAEDFVANPK